MADTKTSDLTALASAPADNDLAMVVDVSDTTMAASGTNKKITVQNLLAGHTGDSSAAHAASAISFSPAGSVAATDVQAAIAEVDGDVTAHVADSSAAHAASAVSFSPTGTIAGTDVQTAVAEVASEAASALAAHEADTTSVHGITNTANLVTTSTALGGVLGGTVGAATIVDGSIVNADISGSAAIDVSKTALVAGNGLGLSTNTLSVNVDDSTLEINSDTLRVKAGGITASHVAADVATQAELDAHTGDTTDAHDASAISIADSGGNFTATDVEGALAELAAGGGGGGVADLDDLTDVVITSATAGDVLVHDGSTFVNEPGGDHFEAAGAVAAHTGDTSDAHDASAISFSAAGNISATDVQAAIEELDSEKSATGHDHSGTYQPLDGDLTAIAGLTRTKGDLIVGGAAAWVDLGVGTDGHVLTADSGEAAGVKWAAASGGSGDVATDAIWNVKGDLAVGTGSDTAQRLAVGGNGATLVANSNEATGLQYSFLGLGLGYGAYSLPIGQTPSTTGIGSSQAQVAIWYPFILQRRQTLTDIRVQVTTLEAGSTCRLGVYASSSTLPSTVGSLIADFGTVDCSTTGAKTASGTQALDPGIYYICGWVSNHSTVRLARSNPVLSPFSAGNFFTGTGMVIGYAQTAVDFSAGLGSAASATAAASSTQYIMVAMVFS